MSRFNVILNHESGATLVLQTTGGPYSAKAAIERALAQDETGRVRVAGNCGIQMDAPIVTSRSGVELELSPNLCVLPSVGTGVGFIHVTNAQNFTLKGGTFVVNEWTDDQSVVMFDGCKNVRVEGVTWDVKTDDGDSDNPMIMLDMRNTHVPHVLNTLVHPAKGVVGWKYLEGSRGTFMGNFIGPHADGGVGDSFPANKQYTPRLCYRALWMVGYEYWVASNNIFFGIGSENDDEPLDVAFLYENPDSVTERGHWIFCDNNFEGVDARNTVYLKGARFARIVGNQFGASGSSQVFNFVNRFDCPIRIEAGAGSATIELDIVDNEFHNTNHGEPPVDVIVANTGVSVTGGNTLALASGSWLATPTLGQWCVVSGFTSGGAVNNKWVKVASATSNTIVVEGSLTNVSAGAAVTIQAESLVAAPAIYANGCTRGPRIKGNDFRMNEAGTTILIRSDGCLFPQVIGNTFGARGDLSAAPGHPPTRPVSFFRVTSSSNFMRKCVVANNHAEWYLEDWWENPPIGHRGPIMLTGHEFDSDLSIPQNNNISLLSTGTAGSSLPRVQATAIANPTNGLAISGNTLTRSDTGGSWLADGIKVGMPVTLASSEQSGNNGTRTVTAVTATVLTLDGSSFNATGSPDTSMTILPHLFYQLRERDFFDITGSATGANNGLMQVSAVESTGLYVDCRTSTGVFSNFTDDTASPIWMRVHPRVSNNTMVTLQQVQ